jgi:hypothetical protein
VRQPHIGSVGFFMSDSKPSRGDILNELIQNPRRLGVAHACLGLIAAFIYWIRPGTFIPVLPKYNFRDISPIVDTFTAWVPYLIAFFVSKSLLANRNPKAVIAYIVLATVVTAVAGGLYLNLLTKDSMYSPRLIDCGVVVALLAAVGLCATIWRSDTDDV